jgi:hypothetical protein
MPTPLEITENLQVVLSALKGERGAEQVELAVAALELTALVLRKNADYGGSALKSPVMSPGTSPQAALRCRMSDKIQRVIKLSTAGPEVSSEGIDDAIDDLAGYGMLDKVLRNRAEAIAAYAAVTPTEETSYVEESESDEVLAVPGDCSVPGCSSGACGECSDPGPQD